MRDIQKPALNLHSVKNIVVVNIDCQFNKT